MDCLDTSINQVSSINTFAPKSPFPYPQKTYTVFWCFQGVEKGSIGNEWIKMKIFEPSILCTVRRYINKTEFWRIQVFVFLLLARWAWKNFCMWRIDTCFWEHWIILSSWMQIKCKQSFLFPAFIMWWLTNI